MAESTLAIDWYDLQAEVGDFAGFGRGARFGQTAWDTVQQGQIAASVNTGLRWVYYTEPLQDVPAGYDWSFLKPRADVVLAEDASDLALPDDFGGIEGEIIPVVSGQSSFAIKVVGPGQLHAASLGEPDTTGRPRIACVEPVKGPGGQSRLRVFPAADAAYTLRLWYYILPDALSDNAPAVYGGAAHAETFLAAVRAAYESKYLNADGPEQAKFRERLRASIARDRKYKPQAVGKNTDRSDDLGGFWPYRSIPVEYLGVQPA